MANEALRNRLYISGWMLSYSLQNIRSLALYSVPYIDSNALPKSINPEYLNYINWPEKIPKNISSCEIAVAYYNGVAVGVATIEGKHIQCFTRKNFRGCGIGSRLVKLVTCSVAKTQRKKLYGVFGIETSENFWKKNCIGVFN